MVKLILKEFLNLWWFRNKCRHGHCEEEEAAIRRKKAKKRCAEIYQKSKKLCKRDRNLFCSVSRTDKWNTGTMLSYLEWAEPLLKKCLGSKNLCRPFKKWDVTLGEVINPP